MGYKPDFENEDSECLYIKAREKDCDAFFNNYRHFGWELAGKTHVNYIGSEGEMVYDSDLYRLTLTRSKHLTSYHELRVLEDKFQDASEVFAKMRYSDLGLSYSKDKVKPDYLDYENGSLSANCKPYTFGVGKVLVNIVCICFAGLGLLMFVEDFVKKSKSKKMIDKTVPELNKAQEEILAIFNEADALE